MNENLQIDAWRNVVLAIMQAGADVNAIRNSAGGLGKNGFDIQDKLFQLFVTAENFFEQFKQEVNYNGTERIAC